MVSLKVQHLVMLITAIGSVAGIQDSRGRNKDRSCDDLAMPLPSQLAHTVQIDDQADLDFYRACNSTTAASGLIISPGFTGPFVFPGVEHVAGITCVGKRDDKSGSSITSIEMPDLKNLSGAGLQLTYLDKFTSLSMPKLAHISTNLYLGNSHDLRKVSFPALTAVGLEIILNGYFDKVSFPSLKSTSSLHLLSSGIVDCPALAQTLANLTITPRNDTLYHGFICKTNEKGNYWNSSDPENNPKPRPSSSEDPDDKDSAASVLHFGAAHIILICLLVMMSI